MVLVELLYVNPRDIINAVECQQIINDMVEKIGQKTQVWFWAQCCNKTQTKQSITI